MMARMRSGVGPVRIVGACFLVSAFFSATVPEPVLGQAAFRNAALEPEEAQSARAFGQEFVRQIGAGRDAAPLVPDWFVDDFPDRLVEILASSDLTFDHRSMMMFWLSPELLRAADRDQVMSYYMAHLNFWYLTNLHNVSRRTPQQLQAIGTFDGALPISVSSRLYESDLFKPLLTLPLGVVMSGDANGTKVTVDTVEDMLHGTRSLELASERLRLDVTRPPAENSATYQQTRVMFERAMTFAPPGTIYRRATVCLRPCIGMPTGTRFLELAVLPSLHLHLIESNRQFRVIFVDLPVG